MQKQKKKWFLALVQKLIIFFGFYLKINFKLFLTQSFYTTNQTLKALHTSLGLDNISILPNTYIGNVSLKVH